MGMEGITAGMALCLKQSLPVLHQIQQVVLALAHGLELVMPLLDLI